MAETDGVIRTMTLLVGPVALLVWVGAGAIGPFASSASAVDPDTLEARLRPLIDAHRGRVAVAVKNLDSGESFVFHGDDPMPTASLIKFPVRVEAYRQAEAGQVSLDAPVTLRAEDKVPGSGILTDHFSPGATFPLRDAIRQMIMTSDNPATNLVLDRIGIPSTAATMESLGYPETKIHSKVYRRDTSVFPERSVKYGLGSTTANEMVRLLEALDHEQLVSPAASRAMLGHLKTCDDREKFPRFLPPGTALAFKTGSVDASRTAAGLLLDKSTGPIALCVLTTDNEDQSWGPDNAGNLLCARVAEQVFLHFKARKVAAAPSEPKPGS
jgi:beta-lactamase class A